VFFSFQRILFQRSIFFKQKRKQSKYHHMADETTLADITLLSKKEIVEAFDQALYYGLKKGTISQDVYNACKKRQFPTMQCIISAYAPAKRKRNDGKGYTQIRYKSVKYYCHRIAAIIAGFNLDSEEEASHCCPLVSADDLGDKRCFNPAHMGAESGLLNKSRLCCILHGTETGYKCPHKNPPCWGIENLYENVNSTIQYWKPNQ
jgi:hypothetical protein